MVALSLQGPYRSIPESMITQSKILEEFHLESSIGYVFARKKLSQDLVSCHTRISLWPRGET